MKVLVTGATGFIGQHIVTAVQEAGHKVAALCRSAAPELAAQGVEIVSGDLLDEESIRKAVVGKDAVIHAAGAVSRDADDSSWLMKVHVTGTRLLVTAACEAGVRRFVNISTSGVVAVGAEPDLVFHEEDPIPFHLLTRWPYYLSKMLAERAAADAVRLCASAGHDQLELITLNPSLALGPGDARGSSTGDVRRYLNRQIPIIPTGGFSFVDARDVASTAAAALKVGRPGERYLLGALNTTCADFFERIGEVSGVPGPAIPFEVPGKLATFGVGLLEKLAGKVGARLTVTEQEADMASHYWYVDARKAEEELGFAPRDPMQTLIDTVRDIQGEYQGEKVIAPRQERG